MFFARVGEKTQSLEEHLSAVARLCRMFLGGCGFEKTGNLLGLLHDVGKYSVQFQNYIQSIGGILKPGAPGYLPDAENMRGKIPHAEVGAWFFEKVYARNVFPDVKAILEMPVVYHHAFPEDIFTPSGETPFYDKKPENFKYELPALFERIDAGVKTEIERLIREGGFLGEISAFVRLHNKTADPFECGLLLRMLYSSLIDADRLDAAGLVPCGFPDWKMLADRLEKNLAKFPVRNELDRIRADISGTALESADLEPGVYRFTIPTGGGKTFAGLRFALNHAAKHRMKRIIYAAPFLSILEQNAKAMRGIIDDPDGRFILEFHSNVLRGKEDEEPSGAVAETWDSPIIATSMVQILNAMFSGESRYARRFHLLSESVLLFDEIQCLPAEMTYLFNRMVNFLAERLHSTVILCSATQPALEKTEYPVNVRGELYRDYPKLFRQLKRVETRYVQGIGTNEEAADFADRRLESCSSLLMICNTKKHAAEMFRLLRERHPECRVFHLSTNLCPAHRNDVLAKIRARLNSGGKTAVVSTSLIEAGVDISFECVIRMLSSLDSIVQAAGRCNRNAERTCGEVFVLDNPAGVKLTHSVSVWSAAGKTALRQFADDPERFDGDPLSPSLLSFYYEELYSRLKDSEIMKYPVKLPECNDTLLNLLGSNGHSQNAYRRLHNPPQITPRAVLGAFRTAGECFKALDDLTSASVIVPYGHGTEIIAELCTNPAPERFNALLRQAQLYTVGVTENMERKLREANAVYCVSEKYGILAARESDYDGNDLGLCPGSGCMQTMNMY